MRMSEKLVIYDSVFGNTAKVAEAIGEALGGAPVRKVTEISPEDLEDLKILFVGSPTRIFNPTSATMTFLKNLRPNTLNGVRAAAFDTRIPEDQADSRVFRFMVKLFGYADKKITKALTRAGAVLALENAGFGIIGFEGPLAEGELDRAKTWASEIL